MFTPPAKARSRRRRTLVTPVKKKPKKRSATEVLQVQTRKRKAYSSVIMAKKAVVAHLLGQGKVERDDDGYLEFANKCIEAGARGEITHEQGKLLMGVNSKHTFTKAVKKAKKNHGKSMYMGPGAGALGRPEIGSDAVAAEMLQRTLNQKRTRNADGDKAFNDALRTAVQKDQRERGVKQVDADWEPSVRTKEKLADKTGMKKLKSGRDNAARACALASPRNLLFCFAALFALLSSIFTFDFKTVHLKNRGNFDAFTVYHKSDSGKLWAVAKKTPLLADSPELEAEYDSLHSIPNVGRADANLDQVLTNIMHLPHEYCAVLCSMALIGQEQLLCTI